MVVPFLFGGNWCGRTGTNVTMDAPDVNIEAPDTRDVNVEAPSAPGTDIETGAID